MKMPNLQGKAGMSSMVLQGKALLGLCTQVKTNKLGKKSLSKRYSRTKNIKTDNISFCKS